MILPPYVPVHIDQDGIAVYSSAQINEFGLPEHYGVWVYRVVELREDTYPQILGGWREELEARGSCRPVHRYSRILRFKTLLYRLLGERGTLPVGLVDEFRKDVLFDDGVDEIWDSCRNWLKKRKLARLYDQIPLILGTMDERWQVCYDPGADERVLSMFMRLSDRWDRQVVGRKYFPNLRFVALKLFELEGVEHPYRVPFIRTLRRRDGIEEIFNKLLY